MSKVRALKYGLVFVLPVSVMFAFYTSGFWTWFPLMLVFGIIPLIELMFKPDEENMDSVEMEIVKKDRLYDYVIYSSVIYQYVFLVLFFLSFSDEGATALDLVGRTVSMGLMCGVFGINVAHELGHRVKKSEQTMAKALLLSSLYMHFFIEHNRGHHKNVSTDKDPASSRRNEWLYAFWMRSMIFSWVSAWKLEFDRLKRKKLSKFHWSNEMLQFQIIQLAAVVVVYLIFGLWPMIGFVAAAFIGGLLLETVNYIEHYGLRREKVNDRRYENVQPHHSWNSNHPVGRLLLFELSRHSDHHFQAHKHYQTLVHHEASPQMPTGYPGMMVLSTIPPLWFAIMNKHVDKEVKKAKVVLSAA